LLRIEVPLRGAAGQTVDIAVRLDPAGKPALVDLRGLTLAGDAGRE
jgi:hypothetical protein